MTAPGTARAKRRRRVGLLCLGLALPVLVALSVGAGAVFVPPAQVLTALVDPTAQHSFLVWNYRLPRVLGAVLAGAMLAVASVLLQTALRNELASPDVVGVSKGAGLGAVVTVLVFPQLTPWVTPVAVVAGAVLAAVVLFLALAPGTGATGVALTGLAVGAIFHAAMMYLVVSSPGDTNQALIWLAGSLYGTTLAEVAGLTLAALAALPVVIALTRVLDLAKLSDDTVAGLGRDPRRLRACAVVVAVLLTAAAVAVVGGIGFLGLLAANIAGRVVGGRARLHVPAAALTGALLLALADLTGRLVAAPSEIPAGIVTAVLGAPYLLHLLRKGNRVR